MSPRIVANGITEIAFLAALHAYERFLRTTYYAPSVHIALHMIIHF